MSFPIDKKDKTTENSFVIFSIWYNKFRTFEQFNSVGTALRLGTTGVVPPIGGDTMKIQAIISRIPDNARISVDDPSSAPDLLTDAVLRGQLLFFEGTTPILKMVLHYQIISKQEALAFICGYLNDLSQVIVPNRHIEEAFKRLQNMARLQIDLEAETQKSQMYVNLSCGIYDILRQELVPLRGQLTFDYLLDLRYRPHCKLEDAPVFKQYVETSLGIDQYDCLLRTFGYALSGLTKARRCCVMLGRPKSGKSTMLDLLEAVLGDDLVSHESFDRMGSEKAKAKYIRKKANISREISLKPNKDAESFKSLISNERTTGEEKYEVQKSFVPKLFFIFAGNVDIEFAKDCLDDAVLDRLYYIIFDKEIPAEKLDLDLDKKLWNERDIIFSMALDSLKGLIEDRYDFREGPAAVDHIKHRRYLIHTVESFLTERCIVSEAGKVSSTSLYEAYVVFCRANALSPESDKSFYGKVMAFNPSIRRGRVPDINGNLVRGFHGLALIGSEHQATDD